jgi:hypothetical protein
MSKKKSYLDYKESYIEVVNRFGIDTRKSYKRQVQRMAEIASDVQCDICNNADDIKINNFEEIVNTVDADMDCKTWKDIVSLSARSNSIKTGTRDKYIKKTKQQIKNEMYKNMQLSNDYKDIVDMIIPDGDVSCKVKEANNQRYTDILSKATKTRNYINNVLYKEYRLIAEAAEYISEGDITYDRFKTIVDYIHYLGGYPKDGSPAKIDNTIYKFLECFYLMKKYSPDFFDEHFKPLLEQYNNMFELVEKRIKPVQKFELKS